MRPGTLIAAILIVVAGFAIGGWLAVRGRGPATQTQRVAVTTDTSTSHAPRTVPTVRPIAARTPVMTPTPLPPTPLATPTVVATAAAIATAAPTVTQPVVATAAPTAVPAAVTGLQGSWQLDEANVHVGTIVWAGDATPRGNSIELSLHKQSVGGRRAVPCERQTGLHATIALGVAGQTVPFREVNCNGVVSTGEVHVTSFNGGSFSGNFSQDGANLGTFSAHKL